LFCCLTLTALLAAAEGLTFYHQELGSRLTAADYQQIEQKITAAFPAAIDQVESFIGDPAVRKIFRELNVAIYSQTSADGVLAFSRTTNSPAARRHTPSVTLLGEPLLSSNWDVKTLLVHEMIHSTFGATNDFENLRSYPSCLQEGLAYFGSGDVHNAIVIWLNRTTPRLNLAEIMGHQESLKFFRERTFVYCFQETYGEDARKKLVTDLFGGKRWKSAVEDVAHDDWDKVQSKCDDCLRGYLSRVIGAAGPLRAILTAAKKKNLPLVIELAKKYLSDEPKSDWRISVYWQLAQAYEGLDRLDEALATYEDIRQGRCGSNVIYQIAAARILLALAKAKKCDEARAKRKEFERFYPLLWGEWRDKLNRAFAEKCPESP
jgi:hypothetical protein